jgi:hypothetical protein
VGQRLADGISATDHTAQGPARWHLPVGRRPECGGHGFAVSQRLSIPPVVAQAIAALGADGVYAWLQPSVQRPRAWRLFAFLVPVLLTTLHFGALGLTVGVWWSVHLWAGTIVLTGLVGLLLSLLLVPPSVPDMPQEGAVGR